MAKKIGQIVGIKTTGNILNSNQSVYKLGVQGPAGTIFYLNGSTYPITIGKYGIYELDLTNLDGYISGITFPKLSEHEEDDAYKERLANVIVDIIYEEQGGTA